VVSRCMPGASARTAKLKAQKHTYRCEGRTAYPSKKDVFECSILSVTGHSTINGQLGTERCQAARIVELPVNAGLTHTAVGLLMGEANVGGWRRGDGKTLDSESVIRG
jgi:hypothetical protein